MPSLLRHFTDAAGEGSAAARLTEAVDRLLDPRAGLAEVLAALTTWPGLDCACVLSHAGGAWDLRAAAGLAARPGPLDARAGERLLAEVVSTRGLRAIAVAVDRGPLPEGTRAACAAPLLDRSGGLLGAALFGSHSADRLDREQALLARVAAERAARVLEAWRLESELTAAAEGTARRTSGFRDEVLAIVGHDLRNPLGAILLSAVLLQTRGGLEGWQAKAVDRVRSSATRMARIIDDLLSYTRTRLGGGIPIRRQAADLAELARRMIDELEAAHPEAAVALSTEGEVTGEWDGARLEQALSNLISNGIDHGEPGHPVEVSLRGQADAVFVRVRSRGEMPRAVLEHAFEAFRRGPEETGRKASGLGLGLYIAREIVRHHGGEISVRCAQGATLIEARLPRRASPDRCADAPA